MEMPRIRLDNCISILIIAVLSVCLWLCKIQISMLQGELNSLKEDLRGSMIYKFPEKEEPQQKGR